MPPRVKFSKDEIISAALNITRGNGIDGVTAREIAAQLNVSTRPIFTWFNSIEEVKTEVYYEAKRIYREHIEKGLKGAIPFLGVWEQFLIFAREERELYKLLFINPPSKNTGGAMEMLKFSQDLVRDSIMQIYNMEKNMADSYFRDIWLVAYGFTTLIVTNDCPYTNEEILNIGAEISLSVCKAYKEIPGLYVGKYNKDEIFKKLVKE